MRSAKAVAGGSGTRRTQRDRDQAAFAAIDGCLSELMLLGQGTLPPEWLAYFNDGISRHALAFALTIYRKPKGRVGRPTKTTPQFKSWFVEAVAAEKARLQKTPAKKVTDRAAIESLIRRQPAAAGARDAQIMKEVDYFARRLSDAKPVTSKR